MVVLLGLFLGLSAYTFWVSRAVSYLSDDPKTCVNCHIMAPEYSTWFHSSHGRVTVCNDCHVPHTSFFRKYLFKASDGVRHATMFALRLEPQVIKIHKAGESVVQQNCIRCHTSLNEQVGLTKEPGQLATHGQGRLCWDCHREVPHGLVRGLSSAPNARVPLRETPKPAWLEQLMSKEK